MIHQGSSTTAVQNPTSRGWVANLRLIITNFSGKVRKFNQYLGINGSNFKFLPIGYKWTWLVALTVRNQYDTCFWCLSQKCNQYLLIQHMSYHMRRSCSCYRIYFTVWILVYVDLEFTTFFYLLIAFYTPRFSHFKKTNIVI